MFLDMTYSEIGRSTGMQLDALRRQLGVGIDPAYDYSEMEQLQKSLTKKKKKPDSHGAAPMSPMKSPTSGLDDLTRALRDVGGGATGAEEAAQENTDVGRKEVSHIPGGARLLQDQGRPSRSFVSPSRNALAKLSVDNLFRAPPVGSYRPKADAFMPRTKNTDFCLRDPTRSRKLLEREREIAKLQADNKSVDHLTKHATSTDLLDEPPERLRRRYWTADLNKGSARPDPVKSAGIVYNVNSFTAGVLDGDLNCSQLRRNPSWDFAKMSVAEPKMAESYFQPGQYKVNLQAVRPGMVCKTDFEKYRARKPLKECVGRVEIDARAGHHLPDRSLARSCPLLEPRKTVPNFDKYTVRPAIC